MSDGVSIRIAKRTAPTQEIDVGVASPAVVSDRNGALDLVCHGTVSLTPATHQLRWGEDVFYFCSSFCQRRFASHPEAFVPNADSFDVSICRGNEHATA